jgi:hypothetical protein
MNFIPGRWKIISCTWVNEIRSAAGALNRVISTTATIGHVVRGPELKILMNFILRRRKLISYAWVIDDSQE